MRLSRKATPKTRVKATGGPWDCYALMIPAGGTMVFRLMNWHGYYDGRGFWHEL